MTPIKLKEAILRPLGVEVAASVPAFVHEDAAIAVTAAYQTAWSSPLARFFTEESRSLTTEDGEGSYALPSSVMRIVGPVSIADAPLLEIREDAHWQRLSLLGISFAEDDDVPQIYHLETGLSRAEPGSDGSAVSEDAASIVLELKPVPGDEYTVNYRAVMHPPRFSACDLEDDGSAMPAPHEFVETFILPLARYYILRSHWFSRLDTALEARLAEDYNAAMETLGLLDPRQGDRAESRNAEQPKQEPQ